jgi:hypothetical protein
MLIIFSGYLRPYVAVYLGVDTKSRFRITVPIKVPINFTLPIDFTLICGVNLNCSNLYVYGLPEGRGVGHKVIRDVH